MSSQHQQAFQFIRNVRARAAARGIDAAFVLHAERSHLLRIGNGSVSLNTSETLTRLDLEVIDGRRQGSHSQLGEICSEEYVQKALDLTIEKARCAKQLEYQPISVVVEENLDEAPQHDPALAELDPTAKVDAYRAIIEAVGRDYNWSGAWSSGSVELFLMSTANERAMIHRGTDQDFSVVLKHPHRKWELRQRQTGWRRTDFNPEAVIDGFRRLLPVYEQQPATRLTPGEYTVAFGAEALADIVGMAMWTGASGRSYEEKRGWTSKNRPGDLVLGENITVIDDPAADQTFRCGFDFSGKVRRRFPLIENGRLAGLMYDAATAAKYNRPLTGHNTGATSIVMPPGTAPDDLLTAVRDLDRVVFIPALHYVHLPDPSKGIFTGSSRFNAVLIERGRVVGPVYSSRVTDAFASVLGNVRLISRATRSVNQSNTYGRRNPHATSVPTYVVADRVKITDCAESF